jgi:hypothetical protein
MINKYYIMSLPTFNNQESNSSVRTKINNCIAEVNSLTTNTSYLSGNMLTGALIVGGPPNYLPSSFTVWGNINCVDTLNFTSNNGYYNGASIALNGGNTVLTSPSDATFQFGFNSTIAKNQTIKAHDGTVGTGANLILSGGGGTVANGVVIISRLPTSNPGPGILWNNAGTPAIGT